MALVAHELKAPLAVMRQLAFALPEMATEGESLRLEMIRLSERAMRQVNDLSRIRRLEDGLFEMEPVAVRAVCDEVTNELARLFDTRGRGLKVQYSNRARLVDANAELLFSVIYNFLVNAVRYSGEGSETVLSVREKYAGASSTCANSGTNALKGLLPKAIHWMGQRSFGWSLRSCVALSWLVRLMPIGR